MKKLKNRNNRLNEELRNEDIEKALRKMTNERSKNKKIEVLKK